MAATKKTAPVKKATKGTATAKPEAVKKATKKVATPKPAPAPVETPKPSHGPDGPTKDVRWSDKKVSVFKALKKLGALSPQTARTAKEVVAASGGSVDAMQVRHYSYHAKAANLIEVADVPDTKGYSFYLTAKGAKIDPDAELKSAK